METLRILLIVAVAVLAVLIEWVQEWQCKHTDKQLGVGVKVEKPKGCGGGKMEKYQ